MCQDRLNSCDCPINEDPTLPVLVFRIADSPVCTDGATDEDHMMAIEHFGQCPWCGKED
jgi:hypothetical protein